jgi:hypothetical protein
VDAQRPGSRIELSATSRNAHPAVLARGIDEGRKIQNREIPESAGTRQAAEKSSSRVSRLPRSRCAVKRETTLVLGSRRRGDEQLGHAARLYAAPTGYEASRVLSSPLKRVLRKFAAVLVQRLVCGSAG